MTGTIVNAVAIVAGTLIGVAFKKGLPKRLEETLYKMLGLSVFIIGLGGVLESMVTVDPATGGISVGGSLLLLASLVIGGAVGEGLRINDHLDRFGQKIEAKIGTEGFSKSFISATMIFCVGAMAIIGSLNDGLNGDSNVLFIKSALDFVCSLVLGGTLGIGAAFSAIPVLIYQGSMTLMASFISPYISAALLADICMAGYAIVMCIGINFLDFTQIKTANLLPSLLVPILYHWIMSLPLPIV